MNRLPALILTAVAFPLLLPTAALANPQPRRTTQQNPEWRDVRRDSRGWQSESQENGERVTVTGFEQNNNAVVIGVYYNPDGTVQSSDRVNLSRDRANLPRNRRR